MRFLIISFADDPHAHVVAAALHELGHGIVLWDAPSASSALAASLRLDRAQADWDIGGRRYDSRDFAAIWLRRRRPVPPPDGLHEDDYRFACGEAERFYANLWSIASPHTRWLHEPQLASAAENKPLQLAIARRIGLAIPPTLISNDRQRIMDFIEHAHGEGQQVIYKTFRPVGWHEQTQVRLKHTTPVSAADIRDNPFVEAVPGIYQHRVAKQFEVRSTFFGTREISVAIDSQRHPQGREDWRSALRLDGYLGTTSLPGPIYEKCLRLMAAMQLETACFDFIVDAHGDYHFLELNQQGQFLWIEEICPETALLDAFVAFFTGREHGRRHEPFALSAIANSAACAEIAQAFRKERFVHV